MRVQREINKALDILGLKTDRISLIQRSILTDKRTEAWVFEHYVKDVSEADKDEEAFYAARDAARFLFGNLTLEELIPDIPETESYMLNERNEPEADDCLIAQLVRRIERLEKQVRCLQAARQISMEAASGTLPDDLIPRRQAYRYVGCSHTLLKKWADEHIITVYHKGGRIYYSRKELDESPVVQKYINKNIKAV